MSRFTIKKAAGLAAVLTAVFLAAGPISQAGATVFPAHAPAGVECNSDTATVSAYAPGRTSWTYMQSFYPAPGEGVQWSSLLEIYTASGWKVYDGNKPWLYAVATNEGLQAKGYWGIPGAYVWTTGPSNAISQTRQDYHVLYRGYYRVWNYFSWDSLPGTDAMKATSYFGVGAVGSYCFIA